MRKHREALTVVAFWLALMAISFIYGWDGWEDDAPQPKPTAGVPLSSPPYMAKGDISGSVTLSTPDAIVEQGTAPLTCQMKGVNGKMLTVPCDDPEFQRRMKEELKKQPFDFPPLDEDQVRARYQNKI